MTQTTFTSSPSQAPCPKCGSHDYKYLSVVYESGLHSVSTQTHYKTRNVATTGTHQSATSERAAPPSRKSFKWAILTLIVGVVAYNASSFLGFILFALSAYFFYTAMIYNSKVYPYKYQVWRQSAMCQRCGSVFVPDASGITLEATSTKEIMAEHQRKLVVAAKPMLDRAQEVGGQVAQKAAEKAEEIRANTQAKAEVSQERRDEV